MSDLETTFMRLASRAVERPPAATKLIYAETIPPSEAEVAETARRKAERDRSAAFEQESERMTGQMERREMLWRATEVPTRFRAADLALMESSPRPQQVVAAKLLDYVKYPGIVALAGPRGTGKTWLACGLLREFARRGMSGIYFRAIDLFGGIKETWGEKGGGEQKFMRRAQNAAMIVIDEIQVRRESAWEGEILTTIIDGRYSSQRSTLIISNLEPAELQASLGESVGSRLTETGEVIRCGWPGWRRERKEQAQAVDGWPAVGGTP